MTTYRRRDVNQPTTSARVSGHGLVAEGRVMDSFGFWTKEGPGRCSCGAHSEESFSTIADRKRWHRRHKAAVIEANR